MQSLIIVNETPPGCILRWDESEEPATSGCLFIFTNPNQTVKHRRDEELSDTLMSVPLYDPVL